MVCNIKPGASLPGFKSRLCYLSAILPEASYLTSVYLQFPFWKNMKMITVIVVWSLWGLKRMNTYVKHWKQYLAHNEGLLNVATASIMMTMAMIISLSMICALILNNLPSCNARKSCSRVLHLCIWKHCFRGYTVFFPNLIYFVATNFSPNWLTFSCLISF